MQPGFFQANDNSSSTLFQFIESALGILEIAAQQQQDRRFFHNRALRIAMKKTVCACGVTMEIDRRVSGAWSGGAFFSEMLFRITAARVQNGQTKIVSALRHA